MPTVDFGNLLPQKGFKVTIDDIPTNTNIGQKEGGAAPASRRIFQTNDMVLVHLEGVEGEEIPWHTHHPSEDQFLVVLDGRVRFHYRDNDGEEHVTEAAGGQAVYLPPGAHNKETVIDGPAELLAAWPRVGPDRLDFFIEGTTGDFSEETIYDPYDLPHVAVEYDNLRGRIIDINEDAASEW